MQRDKVRNNGNLDDNHQDIQFNGVCHGEASHMISRALLRCILISQIVLVSSDGVSIEVERRVAIMSKTVQDMIEGMNTCFFQSLFEKS